MYLLAADFDGTIAQTFIPSPEGINVTKSYDMAIQNIFGDKGSEIYQQIGGLQNRAASELVRDMLESDSGHLLIQAGKQFFDSNLHRLGDFVPEGKGAPLVWDEQNPAEVLGETLVRAKLSISSIQIGTQYEDGSYWPQPCEGFIDAWQTIQTLKNDGIPLNTAVISSGHDLFIAETFRLWNQTQPDILVTEDDIRGQYLDIPQAERVKPGRLPLALAYHSWGLLKGDTTRDISLTIDETDRRNIIYFGDSAKKDGGMAENSGITFGLFSPDASPNIVAHEEGIVFGDWSVVARALESNQLLLAEGKPIGEIISPSLPSNIEGPNLTGKER